MSAPVSYETAYFNALTDIVTVLENTEGAVALLNAVGETNGAAAVQALDAVIRETIAEHLLTALA